MPRSAYAGPAILSYGFRPFFLVAGLSAALFVPVWLYQFAHGGVSYGPVEAFAWHIHEMLYGYLVAVITGFLLTAIPNWTGRLPISGKPLLALVFLWAMGRVAMISPLDSAVVAVVDSLFLVVLAVLVTREVFAGKNWRNAPVCLIVSLLALSNIAFHLEVLGGIDGNHAVRAALAIIVMLNVLIGGRIVPSFTTNWLIKSGRPERPVPFNRFDSSVLVVSAATLVLWVVFPDSEVVGGFLLAAAFIHLFRLARWKGWATISSAIVLVLHAAYLWIPVGLGLLGVGMMFPDLSVSPSTGIHALTVGLMGLMPLAVMSRATLGHTGRELAAHSFGGWMYSLVFLAAVTRVLAAILPNAYDVMLVVSGLLWCAGFLMFIGRFGSMLIKPR